MTTSGRPHNLFSQNSSDMNSKNLNRGITPTTKQHTTTVKPFDRSPWAITPNTLHVVMVFPLLQTEAWKKQGYNVTNSTLVKLREQEYVDCLRQTLRRVGVAKIYLLSDQPNYLRLRLTQDFNINATKIQFEKSNTNPTYRDLFQFASDNLQNKLAFIVNSDNFLGEGFDRINMTFWRMAPNVTYALTRHALPNAPPGCKMGPRGYCDHKDSYYDSHDGFLFYINRPFPEVFLKELSFPSHACGSENVVIWTFQKKLNFKVANPCRRLDLYHNHCTELRAPDKVRTKVNKGRVRHGMAGFTDWH